MRVVVTTVTPPFANGGAESLANGLVTAFRERGFDATLVGTPFAHGPARMLRRSIDFWTNHPFAELDGLEIDRVVCLKFPTYYLDHPAKVTWLLHHHRTFYDLYPKAGSERLDHDWHRLRRHVARADRYAFSEAAPFTISKTVCARLLAFQEIESTPLYHPSPLADRLRRGRGESFFLLPSRVVWHKRVELAVEAMTYVGGNHRLVVCGGGDRSQIEQLRDRLGLTERVHLLGRLGTDELVDLYSRCAAVVVPALDEDYGYVTLEAMAAGKPVVTCTDSGGPLEFVGDEQTGLIVPPNPRAVGDALERLRCERLARRLGDAAYEEQRRLDLSWDHVVASLLAN